MSTRWRPRDDGRGLCTGRSSLAAAALVPIRRARRGAAVARVELERAGVRLLRGAHGRAAFCVREATKIDSPCFAGPSPRGRFKGSPTRQSQRYQEPVYDMESVGKCLTKLATCKPLGCLTSVRSIEQSARFAGRVSERKDSGSLVDPQQRRPSITVRSR